MCARLAVGGCVRLPLPLPNLRLAGLAEVAYGLLVIFVYEFDSPFLNLSHGLGVLHPEFVFHLSLIAYLMLFP